MERYDDLYYYYACDQPSDEDSLTSFSTTDDEGEEEKDRRVSVVTHRGGMFIGSDPLADSTEETYQKSDESDNHRSCECDFEGIHIYVRTEEEVAIPIELPIDCTVGELKKALVKKQLIKLDREMISILNESILTEDNEVELSDTAIEPESIIEVIPMSQKYALEYLQKKGIAQPTTTTVSKAIRSGEYDILCLIAASGFDITLPHLCKNPVEESVRRNNVKITKLLLDKGGIVLQSLVEYSLRKASFAIVQLLADYEKISIGRIRPETAVHIASRPPTDCLDLMMGIGLNLSMVDSRGRTPLMLACGRPLTPNIVISRLLNVVRKGNYDSEASERLINQRCHGGCSALHHLVLSKKICIESLRVLLDAGARVNAVDIGGYTPLMIACDSGHSEPTAMLLRYGADINATNHKVSPLSLTCKHRWLNIAKHLVSSGADIHTCFKIITSEPGRLEMAQFLLAAGAGSPELIDTSDENGYTMLHIAAKKGFTEIVTELLKGKSNVRTISTSGRTPLIDACAGGFPRVVELLCNYRSDISVKCSSGMTALMYAERDHRSGVFSSAILKMLRADEEVVHLDPMTA